MAKVAKRKKAQAPGDSEELAFTGDEALTRLKDFTRRILAVPKDNVVTTKKRPKRKSPHSG